MKYLVFGSSGFLGKKLVHHLRQSGHQVTAIQRKNAEAYNVDIRDKGSFDSLRSITDVDVLINCVSVLPDAARSFDADYLKDLFDTNIIGGANILKFAAECQIKKVVNCSTLAVVNKPWPIPLAEHYLALPAGIHTGYGISKLTQEVIMNELAANLQLDVLHLRLSSLYGPGMKWQGILPMLIARAVNSEKISLLNATKVSFDFLHVADLVKIIESLSGRARWNSPVINVASGEEISLKALVEMITGLSASSSPIEYQSNDQPVSRSVIDTGRLKEMLQNELQLTPIQDGIKQMIGHYSNSEPCVT